MFSQLLLCIMKMVDSVIGLRLLKAILHKKCCEVLFYGLENG
jgi:hypothetical protein